MMSEVGEGNDCGSLKQYVNDGDGREVKVIMVIESLFQVVKKIFFEGGKKRGRRMTRGWR